MQQSICVIEDEKSLSDMIQMNLEIEGFEVSVIESGEEAVRKIDFLKGHDLLILDIMLPKVSGLEICELIRRDSNIPILMLSAKGTSSDKIAGLKKGANDYLSKPFELEELLLRVNSLLNRFQLQNEEIEHKEMTIGQKKVCFETFEIVDEKNIVINTLSKREIDLLKLFQEKEGKVISRDEILDNVWGKDQFPTSRTIDNYILNFRKIFENDVKHPRYFHSIRSVGYKFVKD